MFVKKNVSYEQNNFLFVIPNILGKCKKLIKKRLKIKLKFVSFYFKRPLFLEATLEAAAAI